MDVTEIGNPTSVIEKVWKPHPRQAAFLGLPDTIFEALFGGAAGGGKTDTLLMLSSLRGFTDHPKYKGILLRRTFADLEKEVIPRSKEWYAPMGATYNETKKRWTWPSGASEQFGHCEREEDVRQYDSAEYNTVKWDESTHCLPFQYSYLSFTRCRSSSPDLPAIIRSGTNPGNVGHVYFRERFVDPCRTGGKILVDKVTGMKRIFIPSFLTDNPTLLNNDPTYIKRLEMLPEAEKRAKLYGDWYTFSGQVFKEWRIAPMGDEPLNAQHVIQPFPIPFWWPRVVAIDWGFAAFTFVIWAAIAPDGRIYIYRTYGVRGRQIKDWVADVVQLTSNEDVRDCVICHSAGAQRGEPHTIQQQVQAAFDEAWGEAKVNLRLGERDRIGGKMLVHEYLRWMPAPINKPSGAYNNEYALKLLSMHGERAYKDYLLTFREQTPETNLPKMQIFETSPEGRKANELIDCIASCVYDDKNADGKLPEDVKEFDGDDPYDCLRLVLKSVDRYTREAADEYQRIMKIENVYADLARTNNQTGFYRNMEKIEREAQATHAVRATSRLGHRRVR